VIIISISNVMITYFQWSIACFVQINENTEKLLQFTALDAKK